MKRSNYLACAAALLDELATVSDGIVRRPAEPLHSKDSGSFVAPENYRDMLQRETALQEQLDSILSVGVENVSEDRRLAAVIAMTRLLSERAGRLRMLELVARSPKEVHRA